MKKLLLIIILLCFCFSCRNNQAAETARNVKGTPAFIREIYDEVGGFGTLSYLSKLDITASQDGTVKRIYFREGDNVSGGELLVLLDNPHIALSLERSEDFYSQAKAALDLSQTRLTEGEYQAEAYLLSIEKTEAELARMKKKWDEDNRKHQNQEKLFDAGGINQETIRSGRFNLESEWEQILILEKELEIKKIGCREKDLAASGFPVPEDKNEKRKAFIFLMTSGLRAELVSSAAKLKAAEKELFSSRIANNDLQIKSPASGIIGVRYFEEGERVRGGEKLLTIMDTTSLYAIISVREKEALVLKEGMKAKIQIDGINDEKYGVVDLVYPHADSQSLSFLVRILINGENENLKPGMFSRVRILLGAPRNCIFLPAASITAIKNNEALVYVVYGNHLTGRNVVLGQLMDDSWEIISGIKAGEIAVLRPDSDMREGTYVSLME